jgi:hypothetical protein
VKLSKWGKLERITIAMVGGSVQDERTFSWMNMLTSEQRHWLTTHLELCVRFAEHDFFRVDNFPYQDAIAIPSIHYVC